MSSNTYIHGTEASEQARLSRLNDLINAPCLRELGLSPTDTVLDAGSGLGQLTRAMARGRRARVLGVERDQGQIVEATRQAAGAGELGLVEFRQGDVLSLPLEPHEEGSFDVVFARFVLEHVPDPLRTVREMLRAARPGGRIVLADDDHDVLRLWPQPPGFDPIWRAYMATYALHGNDAAIGRKLAALLHDAGALPSRTASLSFGACAGHPDFQPLVLNMRRVLTGASDAILSTGLLDCPAFERGIAAIDDWSRRADAALWYVICWAEGIAPSHLRDRP